MGVIAKGIPRGCQGFFTPVSLGYPLSVFNKNSTLKEKRERSQSVPLTLPASYSLFSSEDGKRSEKDRRVYLLHSLRLTLFFSGGSGAWTGQSSGGSGTTRAQQLPHLLRLQLIHASRSPTLRPSAAALLCCHSPGRQPRASN